MQREPSGPVQVNGKSHTGLAIKAYQRWLSQSNLVALGETKVGPKKK